MYISRNIEKTIHEALENYIKPICILGARQIGKTTTVKYCLQGTDHVYVNMFDTHNINDIWNENLDLSVDRIIGSLELLLSRNITQDTVIILDEIQSNAPALASLKSFKEDGRFKVIALGSNLGSFLLNKSRYSFPVGCITRIDMYPLSFQEYLIAKGEDFLYEKLKDAINTKSINQLLHIKCLELFDLYTIVGGMPEIVKMHLQGSNFSQLNVEKSNICNDYRNDFGKYEYAIDNTKALNAIFQSIPNFLNKDNKKFIFSEVGYEYKQLRESFKWLLDNNYIIYVPQINSINLPLIGNQKESSFRLFSNETTLLLAQANYEPNILIKEQDKQYFGFVMENYIATVLSKYQKIYTYRKERTELDFLFEKNGKLYIFEVKSGSNKKAKSIISMKNKYNHSNAILLSRSELNINNDIKYIPLYLIDILLEMNILDDFLA